jgi:signal transduction histidine kinase/CheY-like chemotaxis protein
VLLRVRNLLETRFYHRALHERARVATEQAGQALSRAMADFVLRRDIAAVADRIAVSVRTLIQAKTAVVYRVELETGDLVALAVAGGDAVAPPVLRSPADSGVGGRAVRTGRPVTTPDFLADPAIELSDDLRARMADTPLRAALALPMAIQGHVVGTLALFDEAGRAFTSEERTVAQAFADQAAVALEMTRIYDETEQARQVAEKLALVAKGLTETLDVEAIGQQVVAATTSLFSAQNCTLRLLREDGGLQLVAVGGPASHTMDLPDDMPTGMGVPALVVQSGEPTWTTDILNDSRIPTTPALLEGLTRSDMRSVLAVPLRVRGEVKGVLAIADRTGRRFAERHVRMLQMLADLVAVAVENAQHYRAVQKAYEDLAETHSRLAQSQKMDSIGRLAGGIAHDFNNLLTVIMARAVLELDRQPAGSTAHKTLTLVHGTAVRAAALTRQLLAFSRKQVLQPRVLDLSALVAEMEPLLHRLIGEDVTIAMHRAHPVGRVKADPSQLEQVLLNLVVNARDAMPGGGTLTIATRDTVIGPGDGRRAPEVEPGAYVALEVADTGVGMSPDVLTRIFEPFFTTKAEGKGTGLGLATVYGIVKQSGGHVTVTSEPGRGTTFTVLLPHLDEEPEAAGEPAPPSRPARAETVLLVEDDPGVRDLACEILAHAGYRVRTARSGVEALDALDGDDSPVDLLLTDVIMPSMNGAELSRRLRVRRPALRVLFMSGYTDDVLGRQGTLAPGTDLLPKPFSRDDLLRKVREVLDTAITA